MKSKLLYIILGVIIFAFSCTKNFNELNSNTLSGSTLKLNAGIVYIDWSSSNNDSLRERLRRALKYAQPGDTIDIPANKTIHFSASDTGLLISASNVTLRGNTNPSRYGLNGASLIKDSAAIYPILRISGNYVNIIGIQWKGPDYNNSSDTSISSKATFGIACLGDNCKFNYNNLLGWNNSAIILTDSFPANASSYIATVLRSNGADEARITYSYLHDNFRFIKGATVGGYGVQLKKGRNLIVKYCKLDNNLHSITSDGEAGNSYNASYDTIGPAARSYAFDMHGTGTDGGNGGTGGDSVMITNNVLQIPDNTLGFNGIYSHGVRIRGSQLYKLIIKNNKFSQSASQAISFYPGVYALIPLKDTTGNLYNQ